MKTCFECDAPAEHDHHVVPESRGGRRTIPLCGTCHGKVHDLELTDARTLTRQALQDRRARGERAGCLPFGYLAREDGRLVENPQEQAVLRRVVELRESGMSFRAIVCWLAAEGVRGRQGRPLTLKRVHALYQERDECVVAHGVVGLEDDLFV